LIDQLLPTSVHNPEEAAIVRQFRSSRSSRCPYLREGKYGYETVWGNTLPLWQEVKHLMGVSKRRLMIYLGKFEYH
jgi:hypothetical protein